jgi:diacylglycerol kinase family enzyme
MRVALLHNTSAGSEDHTDDDLVKMIGRAGHEVVHVVNRSSALTAALQASPCDLVAVAGGDGTVGRAACELSDWGIPLGILPLGTANNTALALGLSAARMKKLIKNWGAGARLPFDLALLDDGAVRQRYSEAVGWGVFVATVDEAKRRPPLDRPQRQLKRDRKLFRGFVESSSPRPYRIEVDGRDCSGDYLLVEVMNVPFLGPQLEVSPTSNPSDGQLELVLAGEAERDSLDALGRTGKSAMPLPCERGVHIRVRSSDGIMHRDGGLLRHAPGERDFEISVSPGAVSYLR